MKTIRHLFLIGLLQSGLYGTISLPEPITLTSVSSVDGILVTWKTLVEMVHPLMQALFEKLFGISHNGVLQGSYLYNNSYYTLSELVALHDQNHDLTSVFHLIKAELVNMGELFFDDVVRVKPIIAKIIQESCNQRNKNNSFLMLWAQAKPGKESLIFNVEMKTILDLHAFCFDFLVCLHDFVHSCPRARQQLHEQLEKWHKLKNMVSSMIEKSVLSCAGHERDKFLQFMKKNGLARITIEKINEEWIIQQYWFFDQQRK